MKFLRRIRFYIWRWWFLNFGLPRIIDNAGREIREEYEAYSDACQANGYAAIPFGEWCGYKADGIEPPSPSGELL